MAEKKKAGAPKGNKNALGSTTNGRPPKIYNLEKEAEDLLKWSLRDDALRLYGFTDNKDYCASDLAGFSKESIVFKKALNKAKERLANRREQYANDEMICTVVYNKTCHIYDHESEGNEDRAKERDFKRRKKLLEYELQLKAQAEQNKGIPPNDHKLEELISEVRAMRKR